MEALKNLDLLSVGIAIAAIGILGFIVFLSNRHSITAKMFLFLSLAVIAYSSFNYLIFQFNSPTLVLWLLRLVMFFALCYTFGIFQLFYVFPKEKVVFPNFFKFIVLPFTFLTAIITLTPLVFSNISEFSASGHVSKVSTGPGIILFGIMTLFLVGGGIFFLIRRTIKASGVERKQFLFVSIGSAISFPLYIVFNYVLPNFFNESKYVPLAAVFSFPFIAFTAYATIKHHLLNIKVITTEIIAFILAITTLFEVVLAEDIITRGFRFGVFCLILSFGILLIKSVRREVEQREKLQELTIKLEATNQKLTDLDKLKTEFLSFASHQVKTPMIVVKGFAQLIFDGTYGKVAPEVKDAAQKIKQSADKMIVLVNNILDLSRIEEGRMSFKFDDVDINKMVTDISEELKFLASSKGLTLKFTPLKNALIIKADVEKIRQVFQNLVDNSVKYTPKGSVNVAIKDEGDNILFSVIDTGIGLSKELQVNLFQRFVRDQKIKAQIQGTGLGLYIAKQIVEAHKGQVWAESDGEGLGSRFFVRLPKVQAVSNIPAPNNLEKSKPVNS